MNDVSPTKPAVLVTSPWLPKGMGGPRCAPRTRGYLCKVTACRGMYLGWDSGTQGTAVGQEKEADGARVDGEGVYGVGKSQRRAKRRAVTRGISEDAKRKTKQKVRIQKAGIEIKKIHSARNSTSCQADSRCRLGKS